MFLTFASKLKNENPATSSNLIYKRKDLKFSIAGNYLLLIDGRIIYLAYSCPTINNFRQQLF